MSKSFNENSRVKIPAILHLTRLQYKYVSLQQVEQQIDSETNIYKESFRVALNQIFPVVPHLGNTFFLRSDAIF
jgi:type I restriction enzyme R subunit